MTGISVIPFILKMTFHFLSQCIEQMRGLQAKNMCIVSDSTVAPLYADQVKAELLKVTDHVCQFTVPGWRST